VSEDLERAISPDRRTFVKRLVIGSVFAAPVVASFTMSGVQAVLGATPPRGPISPNMTVDLTPKTTTTTTTAPEPEPPAAEVAQATAAKPRTTG
jgi:hypothetical protein